MLSAEPTPTPEPPRSAAGKLFINGDSSAATGAVSVSANATLGGTGIIGGNTTIAATGKLEFNLSTAAGSHDKLELAATKALTFSGASTLTITSSGGASTGLYTLLTAPGGITGSAPATLILPGSWAATVSKVRQRPGAQRHLHRRRQPTPTQPGPSVASLSMPTPTATASRTAWPGC